MIQSYQSVFNFFLNEYIVTVYLEGMSCRPSIASLSYAQKQLSGYWRAFTRHILNPQVMSSIIQIHTKKQTYCARTNKCETHSKLYNRKGVYSWSEHGNGCLCHFTSLEMLFQCVQTIAQKSTSIEIILCFVCTSKTQPMRISATFSKNVIIFIVFVL